MSWTKVDAALENVRVAINTNTLRLLKQFRDSTFRFKPFSQRQKKVLNWWCEDSPVSTYNGIIADGSIRSGKSLSMSLSFVFWAMASFDGCNFAICGKTIGSLRRNVIIWLKLMLKSRGYTVHERRTDNLMIVRYGDSINFFYLFGGRDERSQDLIQGITLAGALFDEVALMPESFVNQATARCSVDGSKWWFNCNPQGPQHWFYSKWIKQCRTKRILYLHFTMDDNLSLTPEIKKRYKTQYQSVFYKRYILGLWVVAEGAIYQQFADDKAAYLVTPTKDSLKDVLFVSIGIDFGGSRSLTTFVATAIHAGYDKVTTIADYHIKARKGEIDADRLCREFVGFVQRLRAKYPWLHIKYCWADNEAQYLINSLRKAARENGLGFGIDDCKKKPITDRIIAASTLLNTKRMYISTDCTLVQGGLESAVWNPKVPDKRLDDFSTDIDIIDAFEYSWEAFIERLCPDMKVR